MMSGNAVDPEALDELIAPFRERLFNHEVTRFAPLGWRPGIGTQPALHLDDVSGIPFLDDIPGVEEYQHRARTRAGEGDLFAATTEPVPGYERYCRETLGLGQAEALITEPVDPPVAVARACRHPTTMDEIVERARQAGGLGIHPYMGIEAVWDLAREVADRAKVPVGVLAPPPPVTWLANDKKSLSDLVDTLLGAEYLVETYAAASADRLADHLVDLASRHRRVALKRLRCASAMGNLVFDSIHVETSPIPDLTAEVAAFLERTEWDGEQEVLAVAWEDAISSPSTQMWIPLSDDGPPRLEGIYEQILEGEACIFVGSRPSTLSATVEGRLAAASLTVATALQKLGYVGRCSFDFLVVGDPDGEFAIRFVECNGRWGGTSTPMSLLDRLLAQRAVEAPAPAACSSYGPPRPHYRAQDFVHSGLAGAQFNDVLDAVGDALYEPKKGGGTFVFYNVGPLARSGKLDVIAVAESHERAQLAVAEDLPSLLGLS